MGVLEISSNPSRCFDGGAVLDGFRAALIDATAVDVFAILSFVIIVSPMKYGSLYSIQTVRCELFLYVCENNKNIGVRILRYVYANGI